MINRFSLANYLVIAITVLLFVAALFTEGFTHNLFLEAGVLLVSVKIIMMNYKIGMHNREILESIEEIKKKILETKTEIIGTCKDEKEFQGPEVR